jgi:hydrogenase nickel incorporation protein HypA/HybF
MHELSIAQSIFEIVESAVPPEQAGSVRTIRVRVGRSSGVLADSLDFCFGVLVADTPLKGARLEIDDVPTVFECRECSHRFQVQELALPCPSCGGSDLALLSGTELQVAEIELLDDSVEAT